VTRPAMSSGAATPRLRSNSQQTVQLPDAIGYYRMPVQEEDSSWSIGFVNSKLLRTRS
jgi:hypothetical protein